jgi:(R)-amidase
MKKITILNILLLASVFHSTSTADSLLAEEETTKTSKLKVAAVSCIVHYRQPWENLKQIAKWSQLAASSNADLVLFNETCVTGYIYSREVRNFAEPLNGPIIRHLTKIARENNIVICAGIPEKFYNKVYNTQVLVGPRGLIGFHRKSSLPNGEEKRFDIGNDANVFTIRGVKVGIAICFESVHPETCRTLAKKGAQVILAPYSNGVTAKEIVDGKRPYFQERARENKVWYIACDESHIEKDDPNHPVKPGAVCFVNPDGEIVKMTSLDEPGEHMIIHKLSVPVKSNTYFRK